MISSATSMVMQLRLDLAEFPAPAVALWELVGAEQRHRALTLLAALIAQAVGGEAIGDELASVGGAGVPGVQDD
jgi:hypothetical protein